MVLVDTSGQKNHTFCSMFTNVF